MNSSNQHDIIAFYDTMLNTDVWHEMWSSQVTHDSVWVNQTTAPLIRWDKCKKHRGCLLATNINNSPSAGHHVLYHAIRLGNIESVIRLIKQGACWPKFPIDVAATYGKLHMVKFIHENSDRIPKPCSKFAMDAAARYGYLDVVKWLHDNRTEGCTHEAIVYAAGNGHLHICIWLNERYPDFTFSTHDMLHAATQGKLLRYSCLKPKPPTDIFQDYWHKYYEQAVNSKTRFYQDTVLDRINCPEHKYHIIEYYRPDTPYPSVSDSLAVLEWFHKSLRFDRLAVIDPHLDVANSCFCQYRFLGSPATILDMVIGYGSLDIAELLRQRYDMKPSRFAGEMHAVIRGDDDILKWVRQHYNMYMQPSIFAEEMWAINHGGDIFRGCWARPDNDDPWFLIKAACRRGHLAIINYIVDERARMIHKNRAKKEILSWAELILMNGKDIFMEWFLNSKTITDILTRRDVNVVQDIIYLLLRSKLPLATKMFGLRVVNYHKIKLTIDIISKVHCLYTSGGLTKEETQKINWYLANHIVESHA